MDHELRASTHELEEQAMQREERAHHVSEGALVQTRRSIPRRRLTTRERTRRRRQRLLELLQHQGKQVEKKRCRLYCTHQAGGMR
jgi:hypothetical protein